MRGTEGQEACSKIYTFTTLHEAAQGAYALHQMLLKQKACLHEHVCTCSEMYT